ncbi:MAG: hypothetical protein M1142_00805 [Patescibacteria group bacterium]|nr:hypothetical protein [Patescibacteria group bacterium]
MDKQEISSTKIRVNLLPQEVILQRKQSSKLAIINKISIVALVSLVFFTSATLTLRLSQTPQLKAAETDLTQAEGQVNSFRSREEQVVALKTRLSSIESLIGGDAKRKAIFNLLVYLAPVDVQISEMSIDAGGNVTLTIASPSLISIDTFISSLGEKEKNSDLISKVELNGLSLGANNLYRLDLKLTAK